MSPKTTQNYWTFAAELQQIDGNTLHFHVLVSRNTREGERPWRLTVCNEELTDSVVPHLTFDEPPTTSQEVEHHLSAQLPMYSELAGNLRIVA